MKVKLEKKYVHIGLTVFFTSVAIILFFFFIYRNKSILDGLSKLKVILAPIIYGLILAYLMTPILNWIEHKLLIPLFHKLKWFEEDEDPKRREHIRIFGVTFTIIFVLALLYLFLMSVIPEVLKSIQTIISQYPTYTKNLVAWINKTLETNPDIAGLLSQMVYSYSSETDDFLSDFLMPFLQNLIPDVNEIVLSFSTSLISFGKFIWNIFIGLIVSIYVLNSKERFSNSAIRLIYAFMETKNANKFLDGIRYTHHTFIGFLSGKVVDSFIIGVITFISLSIMKMPYAVLISIIVGVTNIIPFFGPFFGAIPSILILLMVDPLKAFYFLIFVIILQQFDGNVLGPKILSASTGMTTFWIIFSITLFSGLMGIPGMVIGVPVTAVILTGVNSLTESLLKKKGLPSEPSNYYEVGRVDENGVFYQYEYVKPKKKPMNTTFVRGLKYLGEHLLMLFTKIRLFFEKKFRTKKE